MEASHLNWYVSLLVSDIPIEYPLSETPCILFMSGPGVQRFYIYSRKSGCSPIRIVNPIMNNP